MIKYELKPFESKNSKGVWAFYVYVFGELIGTVWQSVTRPGMIELIDRKANVWYGASVDDALDAYYSGKRTA